MIDRTEHLLKLIGVATAILIFGYCLVLYSASLEADSTQDEKTALLIQGEAARHAAEKRATIATMAVSDDLFSAVRERNNAKIAGQLCATTSDGFATSGLITLSGAPIFLCESGQVKTAGEHDYVFDEPRKVISTAFGAALKAQEKYGVVLPEFNFGERYVEIAGRPYLLIVALVAPKQQLALSPDYQPTAIFVLANLRVAFKSLENYLGIGNLAFGSASIPGNPFVDLEDPLNGSSLRLTWEGSQIFRHQFLSAFPAIIGPSLLLFSLIAYFLKRVGSLQRNLLQREGQMRHAALHDSLTGLPNRAHFMSLSEAALKTASDARPLYLGLFDLDKFKAVNDTFGHDAGDGLICEIAQRAARVMGKDNTVARLGGDEYAIIIRDAHSDREASAILDSLSATIRQAFVYHSHVIRPSCSIGISRITDSSVCVNDALKAADVALYRVKSRGGGSHLIFAGEEEPCDKLVQA